jgi:endonuclease/exonuclease/phosphatase family metal-dependent hydrolase
MARIFVLLLVLAVNASAGTVRIVASNLTSGNHQTYSPDNGNHSNPEGAGARILQGLRPDIVLIQEFNTSIPARQWVNATFGQEFSFYQEANAEIPNGIISRFPILESGEWIDPEEKNRDFVWARIALPDASRILAISVHLSAKKSSKRATEARELVRLIQEKINQWL